MSDVAAAPWSPTSAGRDSRAPALLAAAALHAALLALLALGHPRSPLPLGAAVPITILASDPVTDSRAAAPAPEVQTAQTQAPVPASKPLLSAPASSPPPARRRASTPAPARAAPAPKPVAVQPTPILKAAAPAKPAPSAKPRPSKTFSLDALRADIAKAAAAQPARPASAARGPARAETAPRARPDAGHDVSVSDLQGLQQLLERLWNPNCDVPGGDAVIVPVRFAIGEDGRLVGRVVDVRPDAKPVVAAAARRAVDAVHQAEPYAEAYRGKSFTVNFDAHKACAGH